MRLVILTAVALALAACAGQPPNRVSTTPLQTVPSVDLERYVGLWYEIARLPNRFQPDDCVGVTAEYARRPDGRISVVNRCRDAGGRIVDEATGTAEIVDAATGAKLAVSFFWPFSGDYWVIDLAPDYAWAVVGEPSGRYLWVLSRTPDLDAGVLDGIRARLTATGYDVSKLVYRQRAG